MRTICSLLAGFALAVQPILALPPSDVATRAMPSVALVMMHDGKGQPLALGSAFVVEKGVLVSNLHVVKGSVGGYAKSVGAKDKYQISGILASDPTHDLVLLSVPGLEGPPLSIDDATELRIGDKVYALGNPFGLEGTLSEGIVSGIRKIEDDTLLQITAPISSGSSGGPVLSADARVIGVAVATFRVGQNLNFAIPATYVARLMTNTCHLAKFSAVTDTGDKSAVERHLAGEETSGVVIKHLRDYSGWHFTLQNRLDQPVRNIRYRMIA